MSKVNLRGLTNKFRRAEELKKNVMPKAFAYFKGITPRKSGNARTNTYLDNQNNIRARYDYASVLDEGSSRQAKRGMSEPTIEKLQGWVDQYIRKIGVY